MKRQGDDMLYQTFNSIKEPFLKINWYHLFDNSTLAATIAVIFGIFIGIWQYKKQKKIDRIENQKDKIVDLLIGLKNDLEETDFILQRILNTCKWTKDDQEYLKRFWTALKDHEVPRLSDLINEKIPLTDKKLAVYLNFLEDKKEKIKKLHEKYKSKLKDWHDFIVRNYKEWMISITNQRKIPSELNIKEIEEIINKLIEEIKNI